MKVQIKINTKQYWKNFPKNLLKNFMKEYDHLKIMPKQKNWFLNLLDEQKNHKINWQYFLLYL